MYKLSKSQTAKLVYAPSDNTHMKSDNQAETVLECHFLHDRQELVLENLIFYSLSSCRVRYKWVQDITYLRHQVILVELTVMSKRLQNSCCLCNVRCQSKRLNIVFRRVYQWWQPLLKLNGNLSNTRHMHGNKFWFHTQIS